MNAWPPGTRALVRAALDDDAPRVVRVRALASLEHTPPVHRLSVAHALVPLWSAAPDVAARAHVALLVLAPKLRLVRGVRDDGRDSFDVDDHGRALDDLLSLFGPGESAPAFLFPPEAPLPARYRDPATVREEAMTRLHDVRRSEREAVLARARALGLDDDDLDDDDDPLHPRRFRALTDGARWDSFAYVDDRDVYVDNGVDVVAVGRLRPGVWRHVWRVGDHKRARRVRLAVDVDDARPVVLRRVSTLAVGDGGVTVTAGHADCAIDVDGKSVAVFVDEDATPGGGAEVLGLVFSWSVRR